MMDEAAYQRNAGAGSGDGPPAIVLDDELPRELEIGPGQYLVVSGECAADRGDVEELAMEVEGAVAEPAELSRTGAGTAFWQAIFLGPELQGRTVNVDVCLSLKTAGKWRETVGRVACRDVDWRPVPGGTSPGDDLVAICMATYQPALHAFQRQLDSIRNQTHTNWICIVNDDGTESETWARMKDYGADDDRFVFCRNPGNLGFYRNFESALKKVPGNAAYIALSDQDDRWYDDKLARLIGGLDRSGADLVYSDMRIVDENGAEVAGTYWVNRRNEYRDLKVVLVANTVTGAASLFRRRLLQYLLPFPPRVGDCFHDHWLACTALSMGKIGYVDAPLYDYFQYGSSVIGHCDFVRFTLRERLTSLLRLVVRLCRPRVAGPLLRGKYASALAVYRGECRRLRLIQGTILGRCRVERSRMRALRLFDGGLRSVVRLLELHARVLWTGQTTDDAEIRLAMGEAARIVERRRG